MIENVDGTKMIVRLYNVEESGFCDVVCWAGRFLENLLLNVNVRLIS